MWVKGVFYYVPCLAGFRDGALPRALHPCLTLAWPHHPYQTNLFYMKHTYMSTMAPSFPSNFLPSVLSPTLRCKRRGMWGRRIFSGSGEELSFLLLTPANVSNFSLTLLLQSSWYQAGAVFLTCSSCGVNKPTWRGKIGTTQRVLQRIFCISEPIHSEYVN